jgi:outer membrane protein TolC
MKIRFNTTTLREALVAVVGLGLRTPPQRFRCCNVSFPKIAAGKIIFSFLFIGALALPAVSAPARASNSEPLSLSLDDAVNLAMRGNPMLAAARDEAGAAGARRGMASAQLSPSISTTSFFTSGDMGGAISGPASVMPAAINLFAPNRYFDQNLMLMWPIDVSGRLSLSKRGASRRFEAASYDAESSRQSTALMVRMAYYEILYNDERVIAFEAVVDVSKEQLRIDRVAVEAGKIPAYYIERDKAELATDEQMLAEARRDAGQSRVRLAAAMGLDPATPIQLTDTLAGLAAPLAVQPAPGAQPESRPPEVSSLQARLDAMQSELDSASRARAPEVAVTLMYDRVDIQDMDAENGTTAALVVSFPLWDGGMRTAAKREARGMRDASEQELRSKQLQTAADYQSALLAYDTALKNIGTSETELAAADESYRVAKMRYDAGKSVQVELLDALSALTRARVNRASSFREALMSRDTLSRIAGTM